jgi:hypothetical protein
MDQPPASTPVQDIVSSVPEEPSDEIIDVQNADPVSSDGELVYRFCSHCQITNILAVDFEYFLKDLSVKFKFNWGKNSCAFYFKTVREPKIITHNKFLGRVL